MTLFLASVRKKKDKNRTFEVISDHLIIMKQSRAISANLGNSITILVLFCTLV